MARLVEIKAEGITGQPTPGDIEAGTPTPSLLKMWKEQQTSVGNKGVYAVSIPVVANPAVRRRMASAAPHHLHGIGSRAAEALGETAFRGTRLFTLEYGAASYATCRLPQPLQTRRWKIVYMGWALRETHAVWKRWEEQKEDREVQGRWKYTLELEALALQADTLRKPRSTDTLCQTCPGAKHSGKKRSFRRV